MRLRIDGEYSLTTTVGELIKKLQEFDENALVYTEGCDCIGNAVDVTLESDGKSVLIERDDRAMESKPNGQGTFDFFVAERYKDRMDT